MPLENLIFLIVIIKLLSISDEVNRKVSSFSSSLGVLLLLLVIIIFFDFLRFIVSLTFRYTNGKGWKEKLLRRLYLSFIQVVNHFIFIHPRLHLAYFLEAKNIHTIFFILLFFGYNFTRAPGCLFIFWLKREKNLVVQFLLFSDLFSETWASCLWFLSIVFMLFLIFIILKLLSIIYCMLFELFEHNFISWLKRETIVQFLFFLGPVKWNLGKLFVVFGELLSIIFMLFLIFIILTLFSIIYCMLFELFEYIFYGYSK